MCLLSSLDAIDFCKELIADDVWEAEDHKTVF